jgi:dual-specificity kinase
MKYKIGEKLGDNYIIESHLGDGTFGRTLKCSDIRDGKSYAVKIIRGVKRYNESAETEAHILEDINAKEGYKKGIVYMKEMFIHKEPRDGDHVCLVFETLGKSLYDFVKENKYKGFSLAHI